MHALASLERSSAITGEDLAAALTTPALRRCSSRRRSDGLLPTARSASRRASWSAPYADALALTSDLAALEAEVRTTYSPSSPTSTTPRPWWRSPRSSRSNRIGGDPS